MNEPINQAKHSGMNVKNIAFGAGMTILLTLVLMAMVGMTGGFVSGTEPATGKPRISFAIMLHLATVIPAIPLGAYILWRRKGDRLHRHLGRIWGALMMVTALASLWIGRPGTGIAGTGFSFIHIFSVITIVSIPLGIWAIRKGDVTGHYRSMQGPYIGLLIAGLFAFIPGRLLGSLVF